VEEVRRLLDGAESIAERAAIALAAYAGLRRAEISGLRWDDTDLKEGTISVRRTRWQGRESEPKSAASKNWVPIIRPLAAILREYRRAWSSPAPKRDEDGNEVVDASLFPFDLVFVGRKYALKWHALRRGVATELFAAGASDLDVQRFLRHSKVLMTREHYIKLKDERVERSKRTLDRKFGVKRRK
jgi:integrase